MNSTTPSTECIPERPIVLPEFIPGRSFKHTFQAYLVGTVGALLGILTLSAFVGLDVAVRYTLPIVFLFVVLQCFVAWIMALQRSLGLSAGAAKTLALGQETSADIKTPDPMKPVIVEIEIDRSFEEFSDEDQARVITSIKELLKIGDVRIINRRPPSVILTLELTREQSKILLNAIRSGYFNIYKVSEALIFEKELVEKSGWSESSAEQYIALGSVSGDERDQPSATDLLKNSSLYREFQAEREEILKHKWIESEKAGCDIGFERALTDWIVNHRSKWRKGQKLASGETFRPR